MTKLLLQKRLYKFKPFDNWSGGMTFVIKKTKALKGMIIARLHCMNGYAQRRDILTAKVGIFYIR